MANFSNARIRCEQASVRDLTHIVDCFVVVFDSVGELVATGFEGVTPAWDYMQQVLGPAVSSLSCSVTPNQLRQRCEVTLAPQSQQLVVELLAGLRLRDLATSATKLETAQVLVPYWLMTFGAVPPLPVSYLRSTASAEAGIHTKSIGTENLVERFSSARRMGDSILLTNTEHPSGPKPEYFYRYFTDSLVAFAGTHFLYSGGPLQSEPDSHRLRTRMNGVTAVTHRGILLVREGLTRKFHLVPQNGKVELLAETPAPTMPGRQVQFLAGGPDGTVYFATGTQGSKLVGGTAVPLIGDPIDEEALPGHVTTGDALTVRLQFAGLESLNKRKAIVALDHIQKRLYLVEDTETRPYQILFRENPDIPAADRCWVQPSPSTGVTGNVPSIVVTDDDTIFILYRGCTTTYLIELRGTTRFVRPLANVAGVLSDCSLFPAKGSVVPASSFPFSYTHLKLTGTDSDALLFTHRYCGVVRYRPATETVESLVTTLPSTHGLGVFGNKASQAQIILPTNLGFLPNGDLRVANLSHVSSIDVKKDALSTVRLNKAGAPSPGDTYFSPSGTAYTYRNGENILHRVSATGELTPLMPLAPSGYSTVKITFASDSLAYAVVNGKLQALDLDAGTMTLLTTLPAYSSGYSLASPTSLALGPDEALYVLTSDLILRYFPLTTAGALTVVAGQGTGQPTEGALVHTLRLMGMNSLALDRQGAIYLGRLQWVSKLQPAGLRPDGQTAYAHYTYYPTKAGSDCSGALAARAESDSALHFQQVLNSLCPVVVNAVTLLDNRNVPGGCLSLSVLGNVAYWGRIWTTHSQCSP